MSHRMLTVLAFALAGALSLTVVSVPAAFAADAGAAGRVNAAAPLQVDADGFTLDADGEPLGVAMPTPLICNDIDVTADAIRAGLGIGRLFVPICAQQPDRERFQPVLCDYWKTYPGVYLYHLPHTQKARRVQALIAFLTEKAATIDVE